MKLSEASKILAMVAALDHRVPPLAPDGDDRVPVWHQVLEPLDYATAEKGVLELARDPGLVAIRPGDIYQATKRVMRRHLAAVNLEGIEPPDVDDADVDLDVDRYLAWRRALVRAAGRGATPDAARQEADHAIGVTRHQITPSRTRDIAGLIEATVKETK